MLDKILGKKDKNKKDPPLRKNDNDTGSSGSNVGGRLKNMVSRAGDKSKEQMNKINSKVNGEEKKESTGGKMPRPMPKPRAASGERPRLKPPVPPQKKKPSGGGGLGGVVPGFGRRKPSGSGTGGGRIPDDDQRTLVGAAVFGIILIVLVGAGYYFLVYAPYQGSLGNAKQTKINEVNTYYKGPLATDPQKLLLLADIDRAVTPDQALAVDVIGPATLSWRAYQTQQINTLKDPYGRVMVTYAAGGQKNLIIKVVNAQQIVNQADASVLSNMDIKTPDTVVVPIIVTRLQAAGGLINVGDAVDVYLNANVTSNTPSNISVNQTNQTNQTTTPSSTTSTSTSGPQISGATVLAILRAKDSGVVSAGLSTSQSIAINQLNQTSARDRSSSTDVEQLLRATAAGVWDQSTVSATLAQYGWKLSDFERAANLGDLDVQYLILLEVPRENALFLMQNMNSIMLTVPTSQAPSWMITELHRIYGS